ncbi:MAG: hypothetical protein KGY54_06200, partial [Oleiphilaceae bacterium]|nr:hypothetical protein [Oleiphilaceae bacterium]
MPLFLRLVFGLILLTICLASFPLKAATVFGVVSERSAAEMAAGAERFNRHYPEHKVVLRTTEQVAKLG